MSILAETRTVGQDYLISAQGIHVMRDLFSTSMFDEKFFGFEFNQIIDVKTLNNMMVRIINDVATWPDYMMCPENVANLLTCYFKQPSKITCTFEFHEQKNIRTINVWVNGHEVLRIELRPRQIFI